MKKAIVLLLSIFVLQALRAQGTPATLVLPNMVAHKVEIQLLSQTQRADGTVLVKCKVIGTVKNIGNGTFHPENGTRMFFDVFKGGVLDQTAQEEKDECYFFFGKPNVKPGETRSIEDVITYIKGPQKSTVILRYFPTISAVVQKTLTKDLP